ncbi:MAG: 30S ribosomal protein S16 [Actinomycetota bacterium]
MAVRIRLMRGGAKKAPTYRVTVADSRSPRDGRFIETIGVYQPREEPSLVKIDEARALYWLSVGAKPSAQVQVLLKIAGIWEKFEASRPAPAAKAKDKDKAKAKNPGKKAEK